MVNIEVSDNERYIIDTTRKIEKQAYHQGFIDGGKDAEEKALKDNEEKIKKAYLDGKAKAYREIQIGRFMEETDRIMWIPGDEPEEDGEYLVTTKDFSTPIALNFQNGEWQMPKKHPHIILAFRKMPAIYVKED